MPGSHLLCVILCWQDSISRLFDQPNSAGALVQGMPSSGTARAIFLRAFAQHLGKITWLNWLGGFQDKTSEANGNECEDGGTSMGSWQQTRMSVYSTYFQTFKSYLCSYLLILVVTNLFTEKKNSRNCKV
jgi:hypothetical protein